MARRASRSTTISRSIVPYSRPSGPTKIEVRVPRAPTHLPKPKAKRRPGHARSGGDGGSITQFALGGAALALVEKSGIDLPTIPLLGKKGTLGVVAWFIGKNSSGQTRRLALTVSKVVTAMAVYELVKDGKISGDDE